MRVGVRLQIVLALSALLALAFVPLFAAVASLTSATLHATRTAAARALGELAARHVADAAPSDRGSPAAWKGVLAAEARLPHVLAVAIYDETGALVAREGDAGVPDALPAQRFSLGEQVAPLGADASVFRVVEPIGGSMAAAVVVRPPDDRARAAPLVRLVALYTGMVALALLVFAYIALTRIIVRPLEALSNAARKVAAGARTFEAPSGAAVAELADLAASVSEMTATLRADEERMRAQITELEERARALRQAQDRLVRSERLASVGRLAAGLAHEIGNPIAAMMGLEDLLLAGGLEPNEERDFLRRIRAETERVHRVLRNLLDFARPASSQSAQGPRGQPGDVRAAIEDVLALVRPQPSFRDLTLESRLAEQLEPVALDRERIMQVVLNLLMNAADSAGPKGRVRIAAEPSETAEGTAVSITVEDDGPGVDPAILPSLFEPFASTKEVGKGTGLGLAVCRGLVEAAGGWIGLDETYGPPGARFVVELPAARATPAAPSPAPAGGAVS